MPCLVSLDECIHDALELEWVLEEQCLNSYLNGQKKQFIEQYAELECKTAFIQYVDDSTTYSECIEILKFIIEWSL